MHGRRERGFTLIELMIVVSIIDVLALIGVPHFRGYALDARLSGAEPLMAQIAAKMRSKMIETGQYCCAGDPVDEDNIISELGVPLDEEGDFCWSRPTELVHLAG